MGSAAQAVRVDPYRAFNFVITLVDTAQRTWLDDDDKAESARRRIQRVQRPGDEPGR